MRNSVRQVAAAAVVALFALSGASAFALDFGEKAPELEPTAWTQGEAIKVAEGNGKNVFIVAFISTFKPECQQFVPDATKLLGKYGSKGLEVVAVTTETADEVKAYLADHKAGFRFASDGDENTRAAYKVRDVPYVFVIDRTGAVVFMGDPGDGMEKAVDDVMTGKFDLKKALELRKLHTELSKAQRSSWTFVWKMGGVVSDEPDDEPDEPEGAGDTDGKDAPAAKKPDADAIADQILALDATDSAAFNQRCSTFEKKTDIEGYRKFVKGYVDRVKDDAKTLALVASKLSNDNRPDWRDPELALAASRRAVELSKSAEAGILDTYAHVLSRLSLLEMAIVEEKKAVALDAKEESYKRRLAFYETCLAARARAGGGAPKKK